MREGPQGWQWGSAATLGALVLALGCTGARTAKVERIRVDTSARVSASVVAIDRVLVGMPTANVNGAGPPQVMISTDGAHWHPVRLPNAPAAVSFDVFGPKRHGKIITLTGRGTVAMPRTVDFPVPAGPFFVWTSTDGRAWKGGELIASSPPFVNPGVQAAGETLLVSGDRGNGTLSVFSGLGDGHWRGGRVDGLNLGPGESAQLQAAWREGRALVGLLFFGGTNARQGLGQIRSVDGGATWSTKQCGPDPQRCREWVRAPGLVVRGEETSTDEGRTWSRLRIVPPVGEPWRLPRFGQPAPVPGGWIAAALDSEIGDRSLGFLLRSSDGRTWRRAIPGDPCRVEGRPNSSFSSPVRAGDHWYTVYRCLDLSSPLNARIYEGDERGQQWKQVRGIGPRTQSLGDALVFRGRVLVPVLDSDTRLAALVAVNP